MTLYEVITAAVRDIEQHGYDSPDRIAYWSQQIREAAGKELIPESVLADTLRRTLGSKYESLVTYGGLLKRHKIDRYSITKVQPKLRAELDRRIMASADLIKLNREQAIEKTLQRFRGWSTSIPSGGSKAVDTRDTKTNIAKALKQLPFEERRVLIDQGHKLVSAVNEIVATGNNAIAVIWHSHYRQAGYNYRKDHKERDGRVYAIRGNWALDQGLMKVGDAGYYDDITHFAEEPFCRCFGRYIYSLRSLPDDMVTEKGRRAMMEARNQSDRLIG